MVQKTAPKNTTHLNPCSVLHLFFPSFPLHSPIAFSTLPIFGSGGGCMEAMSNEADWGGAVRQIGTSNSTTCLLVLQVLPTMSMQEHQGNEKSCVWHASDFADGELKEELFCIRFASVENCKAFKDKIEEITKSLAKDSGDSEEANTAAGLIEKLSVETKEKEEKPQDKDVPVSAEEKKTDEK